jgi:O-antigen/teichoic acid export membrane protein
MVIVAQGARGHTEIGMFSAANQWFPLLLFLPNLVVQSAFPILVERLSTGAVQDAWRLVEKKILYSTVGLAPIVFVIALLSPWIMRLYGAEYGAAWPVLVLVVVSAWVAAPQGTLGNMLMAHGLMWTWFSASLIWAGTLIAVVVTCRSHGALAIAAGHLAAYVARGIYGGFKMFQLARARGT